jgi:hypothetical protein
MPDYGHEIEFGFFLLPDHGDPRATLELAGRLDDDELRRRPAGSRPESLAGTYLLGHLHGSGYATVLDPVPVADLVRSTNIVAVAPAGPAPSVVVVTPYDTPEQGALSGGALAVFLEVARALRMAAELDPRAGGAVPSTKGSL